MIFGTFDVTGTLTVVTVASILAADRSNCMNSTCLTNKCLLCHYCTSFIDYFVIQEERRKGETCTELWYSRWRSLHMCPGSKLIAFCLVGDLIWVMEMVQLDPMRLFLKQWAVELGCLLRLIAKIPPRLKTLYMQLLDPISVPMLKSYLLLKTNGFVPSHVQERIKIRSRASKYDQAVSHGRGVWILCGFCLNREHALYDALSGLLILVHISSIVENYQLLRASLLHCSLGLLVQPVRWESLSHIQLSCISLLMLITVQ